MSRLDRNRSRPRRRSKGSRVDAACHRPALGGEPLWCAYRRPSTFPRKGSPAIACENKRLPGVTQRDAFTCEFRFVQPPTVELRTVGSFAGAACCDILWPTGALKQISRGHLIHAKAAPLQALGDRTLHQPNPVSRTTTRTRTRTRMIPTRKIQTSFTAART